MIYQLRGSPSVCLLGAAFISSSRSFTRSCTHFGKFFLRVAQSANVALNLALTQLKSGDFRFLPSPHLILTSLLCPYATAANDLDPNVKQSGTFISLM